ncbi:hypothetical protein OGAPHI_003020 [Ogataea philodendri]|uniref:Uncharacterized protein n=1 Tax=Ogataea philodendri TaxID=1378263 RepID=A0A9P8T6X2_9ASCO|nr:uncharacterized protein OGAPHI_003020 [Ogataea philodendri]KAH3667371.1 hypothetical protein OGAPHI_003020 [Ogataea philodendri]
MASSNFLAAIDDDTLLVSFTASISGLRTILPSRMPIIGDGVSGVFSRTARTASTPCNVASILSNATAVPPRWTWPSVVILVSSPISTRQSLTWFDVMGFSSSSKAPSATITVVFRRPFSLCREQTLLSSSRHEPALCGRSGMKIWSAPHEMPAINANHPQCRPITSTTNARECEAAVESM